MGATLSASKIYQKAYPAKEISFAQWLQEEKMNYNSKVDSFKRPLDFDTWLNIRWDKKLAYAKANESADGIGDILGKINETANTVKEVIGVPVIKSPELIKQEAESDIAKQNKTILGLNPIAAYTIGAVALLGVGFVIYKIVKRSKK